jgi:hypothetical protein
MIAMARTELRHRLQLILGLPALRDGPLWRAARQLAAPVADFANRLRSAQLSFLGPLGLPQRDPTSRPIMRRLNDLVWLTSWADSAGATHIGWGPMDPDATAPALPQ